MLFENWSEIKCKLEESEKQNNYYTFINYISNLSGFGAGTNKMRIKIPLILRELRCQNICRNIPGEMCCVPDNRVLEAANCIGIILPRITSINSIFKASRIIY